MTNQHPITPPYELIEEWIEQFKGDHPIYIATQAAQWGADQELEACVEWLGDAPVVWDNNGDLHPGSYLRDARRPKPSLKEQAMCALIDGIARGGSDPSDIETIRRALEALPE
jgi:hypothetical protein